MVAKKSQKELRFEREAKALQKNIAKRKKQQANLDKQKQNKQQKDENNG